MMIATLQTNSALTPTLSVHGGIIKLDMGALLLEMDTETFKGLVRNLIDQATEHQIEIWTKE